MYVLSSSKNLAAGYTWILQKRFVPQMLTDRDTELNTAIHMAVDSGKQEIVQMCLEKGNNLNLMLSSLGE